MADDLAAKFSPLAGVALDLKYSVHLLDSDVITFKIPQDHHKITDNTIITLCHHEGSQHFFSSTHTRTSTVFYTRSYPSFSVFQSSTTPGPLFHSSHLYIYSFLHALASLYPPLYIIHPNFRVQNQKMDRSNYSLFHCSTEAWNWTADFY